MSLESAFPVPDPKPAARGLEDEIVEAVATRAAAWVNERQGHLHLEMAPSEARGRLLDQLGARLPARCRWARTRAPQSTTELAIVLLDDDHPDIATPQDLAAALEELAASDAWTVLAINDIDGASVEALETLHILAGLGGALQLVMVGDAEFAAGQHGASAELVACAAKRMPVELAGLAPAPAAPTPAAPTSVESAPAPVAPTPAATTPVVQPWSETRDTHAEAPSVNAGRLPMPAALERQHDQDPFRNAPTGISLNTPALIPVLSAPHSAHAEWFRILRIRLEDWVRRTGGGPKSLLVTGPDVAMGKTFVSANLALLWAQSTGQRVLLVDGDLRRPQFHAVFEIPRRPGFADLLSRRNQLDECNAFVSEVGMNVMPAGRPGNPRHLVNPERVEEAVAAMRGAFDMVIIDSPPLNGMVDGRSMAAAADGVLMVVRSRRTRFASLKKALDFLPSDNLVGAVVNAGEVDAESAYYKYRRAAEG